MFKTLLRRCRRGREWGGEPSPLEELAIARLRCRLIAQSIASHLASLADVNEQQTEINLRDQWANPLSDEDYPYSAGGIGMMLADNALALIKCIRQLEDEYWKLERDAPPGTLPLLPNRPRDMEAW